MVGGGGHAAMSPAPSGGKRGRAPDPEEDVYVDNLHSHKRYLTEMMASSMNGLSVGDSVPDNIMGSPIRLENAYCIRDEMSMQYSPMSEESDDYRYYDTQVNTNGNQTDVLGNSSTGPVSFPHRFQKLHTWFSSACPYPLPSCSLPAVVCSPARRGCGTEQEGRIPSSPNDVPWRGSEASRTFEIGANEGAEPPPSSDMNKNKGVLMYMLTGLNGIRKKVWVYSWIKGLSCPKSTQDVKYQSPINRDQHPHHDVDFVEDQITV